MKKIRFSYFILLVELSLVALYMATPHFWVLQIFSVIPPFLFFVPGVLCFFIAIFRKHLLSILLSISLCVMGLLFVDFNFAALFYVQTSDNDNIITVFNSNTTLWNQKDPKEYLEFLKAQNADIYHLQEVIPPREKGHPDTAIFKKYLPGYTIVAHHELVTLSRIPIKSEEYKEGNDFQKVTVSMNGQDMDFYNVHMRIHLLIELLPSHLKEFLSEMKERYYWREDQFKQLLAEVKESKHAYISGDFNTSKTMGIMRPLQEITQDSFSVSRDFFPITWNMKDFTQWWRIDYNLVKGIRLLRHEDIEQSNYSDHRAQRVLIGLD